MDNTIYYHLVSANKRLRYNLEDTEARAAYAAARIVEQHKGGE